MPSLGRAVSLFVNCSLLRLETRPQLIIIPLDHSDILLRTALTFQGENNNNKKGEVIFPCSRGYLQLVRSCFGVRIESLSSAPI